MSELDSILAEFRQWAICPTSNRKHLLNKLKEMDDKTKEAYLRTWARTHI